MPPNKGFRNNPNLNSENSFVEVTKEQCEYYTNEIVRCAHDPIYFAEKYYTIISPGLGKHKIKMYDKQKELIKSMFFDDRIVLLSARQTGKCQSINTKITIRNKKTGEIEHLTIKQFMDKLSLPICRVSDNNDK